MPPSTEAWPIAGCPGYFITRDGRVYSTKRPGRTTRPWPPKLLRPQVKKYGYHVIRVQDAEGNQYGRPVHQLVLETFVGPAPVGGKERYECDHKDGNTGNNCVENLEWVPQSENIRRARERAKAQGRKVKYDVVPRGADHARPRAKLAIEHVREIRAKFASGYYTRVQLAEQYGVTPNDISNILRGVVWNIPQAYPS